MKHKISSYCYKIVWSKELLSLSVEILYSSQCHVPLTTFYFWPREDSWILLKTELESKPWLNQLAQKKILSDYTKIINYWLANRHKNYLNKKIICADLLQTEQLYIKLLGFGNKV